MKKFMSQTISFLIFLLVFKNSLGQTFCGTELNIEKALSFQKKIENDTKTYSGIKPTIRLALHNVNKDNGTGGNSWDDIRNVVAGLSNYYQEFNICFVVVSENTINRDEYFDLPYFAINDEDFGWIDGNRNDWPELISENRVQNAINIYFVKNANSGGIATGSLFDGPTNFPTVTLSNSVAGYSSFNSKILAHEIGHCLGLYHTHSKKLGLEQIPRTGTLKNCDNAGDLLCDTPADPNLNISSLNVDESCYYIGGLSLNGFEYEPDPSNLMSYSIPSCLTNFTNGQGQRMRSFIFNTDFLTFYLIPSDYNLSGVIFLDKFIGVEKTIVSNAKHYGGNHRYEAGNSIRLTDGFQTNVGQDFSFNAKIKPISCSNEFTGNDGIITKPGNEVSNNKKAIAINEQINFSVFPNPTNNIVTVRSMNQFDEDVSIEVHDINGKTVSSISFESSFSQEFNVPIIDFENLKQGVYFLKISNSKFSKTYKVVKCENQ